MTKRVWVISLLLALIVIGAQAQENAPTLTLIQDVVMGFDTPIAMTLQPDAEAVWVVFSDDARIHYSLRSFSTSTGEPLDDPLSLFEDPGGGLFSTPFSSSLALMPNGMLRLVLHALDHPVTYIINPETGESTVDPEADAEVIALFSRYTSVLGSAVFSSDQGFAAVSDADTVTVFDMQVGWRIFRLHLAALSKGFSSHRVWLYALVAPEAGSTESSLQIYTIPGGELLRSIPTQAGGRIFPGYDGRYVGFNAASGAGSESILGVIDSETGAISNLFSEAMPPFTLDDCTAVEGDTDTSLDVITGWHQISDVVWLPDGVTFVAVSAYIGQGAAEGQEAGCEFTANRLRIYRVNALH